MMMNIRTCKKSVVLVACFSLLAIGYPPGAGAAFITTDRYQAAQDRQARVERVQAALLQERISQRLQSLGVNPEQARQRVAALPDADLVKLDERLEDLPAGAGALELVLVVFLVLLILDLAGVTNIFPGIGPGKVR